MKRSVAHRLAVCLTDQLERTLPPDRKEWAAAMRAEVLSIESPLSALSFAAGCLWAGYRERQGRLYAALMLARYAVGAVTVLLATVAFVSVARLFFQAWRHGGIMPVATLLVLGGLGFAYAAAGFGLLRRGPAALAGLSFAALLANSLAFLFPSGAPGNPHFLRAVIGENFVTWSLLLIVSLLFFAAARSRRLHAFASARGWA